MLVISALFYMYAMFWNEGFAEFTAVLFIVHDYDMFYTVIK